MLDSAGLLGALGGGGTLPGLGRLPQAPGGVLTPDFPNATASSSENPPRGRACRLNDVPSSLCLSGTFGGMWWGSGVRTCKLVYARVLSRFSCVQVFETPRTISRQAPLSLGFSRQESWGGLPVPSPGDLPDPGTELTSLTSPALAGGFFTSRSSK